MIPIIYESTETAFVSNGLGRLRDCLTFRVTEERNSVYEAEFTYPVDGANFDLIKPGRVVAVTHDDTGDIQPFDIVSYSRPIDGIVTFHCVHLSYRLRENAFSAQNISDLASAVTTLNTVLSLQGSNFTISADFTASGYASVFDATPRTVRQCLGGTEGSLLDAYGGEYKFDKWNVYLMKSRGTVRDLTIRYGVNMTEYQDEADFSGTYNKCLPYWKSGDDSVAGNAVSTGQILYSGRDVAMPLDLSDKFENKPTTAQLEAKALSMMNREKSWQPSQNISVNFIRLQDSPEYEQYAPLMTCSLCDTINMVFPRYNVSGSFKIVRIVWDVLQGRYVEMELGDLKTTLSEALGVGNSTSSSGGGGGSDGIASCTTIPAGQAIAFDTGTTWTDISSTTYPDNCSITLSNPGVYILFGTVAFSSNASGRRACRWYDVTNNEAIIRTQVVLTPANGAITYMQTITCVQITSSTTYKLQAYQNSGSQLNVTPYRSYVQIAAVPQARGVSF